MWIFNVKQEHLYSFWRRPFLWRRIPTGICYFHHFRVRKLSSWGDFCAPFKKNRPASGISSPKPTGCCLGDLEADLKIALLLQIGQSTVIFWWFDGITVEDQESDVFFSHPSTTIRSSWPKTSSKLRPWGWMFALYYYFFLSFIFFLTRDPLFIIFWLGTRSLLLWMFVRTLFFLFFFLSFFFYFFFLILGLRIIILGLRLHHSRTAPYANGELSWCMQMEPKQHPLVWVSWFRSQACSF